MSFGRHKRLLLGALALLAPLPLPLNDVVGWPAVFGFWLAVGLFLRRAWQDVGGWLPNWAMNLLAIAYVPILALDLGVLWRGRILQPVVHLLLYGLAVKLFALKREKDTWQAVLVLFFVFLAATGTSVHPSVLLYVIAFLAGMMLLLSRFVGLDMLTLHPRRAPDSERVPLRGFVTGGVVFCLVAAIPLFVFLPRLRSPYVVGPGGGTGSLTQVAAFQEVMRLDGIGRVRGSRAVVMRLTYDSPPPRGHETRMKVKVYETFSNDQWSRGRRRPDEDLRAIRRNPDGLYPLGTGAVASWVTIWMQPLERHLAVPVDGVRLDLESTAIDNFVAGATGPVVVLDHAGEVRLPFGRSGMVTYRVGLVDQPRAAVSSPLFAPNLEDNLALDGVTPRIRDLSAGVLGEGSSLERAARVERFLSTTYDYTLDLIGTPAGEGIETFLFENRRGHCELFASSMVLMLRSQGIPARLATGFLGADYNPIEGYYIVRESNAHAWVEVFDEVAGWRVFDPTPAAGRPVAGATDWTDLLAQLYDSLVFRWDRYILTFGLADQVGFVASLRDLWETVSDWLSPDEAAAVTGLSPAAPEASVNDGVQGEAGEATSAKPWWPLTLALLLATAAFFAFQRRRFSATAAYLRLRERLRPEVGPSLESMPPLVVASRYAERFPRAAEPARQLVDLYLGESFGGRRLSGAQTQAARDLLRQALKRRAA